MTFGFSPPTMAARNLLNRQDNSADAEHTENFDRHIEK